MSELDITNGGNTLNENLTKHLIGQGIKYKVPPSLFISQLYYESNWGASQVAKDNNNWGGFTWSGNSVRPSGIIVSRGTARPVNEGGFYMKFKNIEDYLTDYVYLLTAQGIYNIQGKSDFSESVKGLFVAGGAKYNYATVSWEQYVNTMLGVRSGINSRNNDILTRIDKDPKSFVSDVEPTPPPDPDPDENEENEEADYDLTFVGKSLNELADSVLDLMNKTLTVDLFSYDGKKTYGNSFLSVTSQLNNMYKIKPTLNFNKIFNDIFKKAEEDMKEKIDNLKPIEKEPSPSPDPIPDPDPDPEPDPEPDPNKPSYPTVSKAYLTSPWGPRWGRWHDGIDLGVGNVGGGNPPIYATQDGEVISNYWHRLSGWVVRIKHSKDPYFSGYQHLKAQSPIKIGTVVKKGTTLGAMGATGEGVTGIHLHFQIAKHNTGWYTQAGTIDPEKYLKMTF